MLVNQGLVGPKPRPKGVGDGYAVNIRQLFGFCLNYGGTEEEKLKPQQVEVQTVN